MLLKNKYLMHILCYFKHKVFSITTLHLQFEFGKQTSSLKNNLLTNLFFQHLCFVGMIYIFVV